MERTTIPTFAKPEIYFCEKNIYGAWVIFGSEGIKQYYWQTKKEAMEKYRNDSRTLVNVK